MTAPTPPDRAVVARFWQRYLERTGDPDGPFTDATSFGDSVELADELIALVLDGPKRATAGSVAEYRAEGVALPRAGDRWIACDGRGTPRVVIRTTESRVGPLSSVDEQFAWDEGEGDRSLQWWLDAHHSYFERSHARLGVPFHPDIEVVFERFEILYSEPDR